MTDKISHEVLYQDGRSSGALYEQGQHVLPA